MKPNRKMARQLRNFEEVMGEESMRRPLHKSTETIEYEKIYAKFRRAMDAHEQHGPVKVLVANGKPVV